MRIECGLGEGYTSCKRAKKDVCRSWYGVECGHSAMNISELSAWDIIAPIVATRRKDADFKPTP